MNIIDISVTLDEMTHSWPGSYGLKHNWVKRISDGDSSNDSVISCDSHLGTHVDAPLHFIDGAPSVESMPLDILCGTAYVVNLGNVRSIGEKELESVYIPDGTVRLLLKTGNSLLWKESAFNTGFTALTDDGASWLIKMGIGLVGIDYLSIGPYPDGDSVHRILLSEGVAVVEGLNMSSVTPGWYNLVCLPLKVAGAEGAPARAILMPLEERIK